MGLEEGRADRRPGAGAGKYRRGSAAGLQLDAAARRRVQAVRRQFEALRPKRKMLSRQSEGSEIDLDELVRASADRLACGQGSERLFRDARNEERDLAVAVLFDSPRARPKAPSTAGR